MKLKTTEAQILKACLQYLVLRGVFHWRQNTSGIPLHGTGQGHFRPAMAKGLPDIFAVKKGGKIVAIECKSEKGKLSEHQVEFGKNIVASGGEYYVVRSVEQLAGVI